MSISLFTSFKSSINSFVVPKKFTFPFYYTPDPLAVLASEELQEKLVSTDFGHDFGLKDNADDSAIGKMFGVLVVKNQEGELGYLSAFSGKLGDRNDHEGFVPPIYDMLAEDSYFVIENGHISDINRKIVALESNADYLHQKSIYDQLTSKVNEQLSSEKSKLNIKRKSRKEDRITQGVHLDEAAYKSLLDQHKQLSINDQFLFDEYKIYLHDKLANNRSSLDKYQGPIGSLRTERATRSNALQQWLFDQYDFLNINGESRNVVDIFLSRKPNVPPAGAGECAAPKLLQYAFLHGLTPVALAEFWWGKSSYQEVRKHKNYYPACRGKCEPILGHMLAGIEIEENPLIANLGGDKQMSTVYEDEHLVVINKPHELLSTPGIAIKDSVQSRMKEKYPEATGPLIVHRLDMSTSGLLVIAKTMEIYKHLQDQFSTRKVKKRYVALLDGRLDDRDGVIDLPLMGDHHNRPFQIVSSDGKSAQTRWTRIAYEGDRTRVHFYPITGRTHQLRVHAAHHLGLNIPIVGDDLYGQKGERLCLHAESIEFEHPVSGEKLSLSVSAEF